MIKETRKQFKAWKMGNNKEEYLAAKHRARREAYRAKKVIQHSLVNQLNTSVVVVSWELLYANNLVLIVDNTEKTIVKFKRWRDGMKSKGLCVNVDILKR